MQQNVVGREGFTSVEQGGNLAHIELGTTRIAIAAEAGACSCSQLKPCSPPCSLPCSYFPCSFNGPCN
eukprot:5866698-Amphidinium_carterae.1